MYDNIIVWNISLFDLRKEGIITKNVCYGKDWNGFITKPKTYIDYMSNIISDYNNVNNSKNYYAILMDSDTMFSGISSVKQIWDKYDCILQKQLQENKFRDIVMSTETSCWVGQYCTTQNITDFYNKTVIENTPSYSPFANSGIIMGSMNALIEMLNYVVENNLNYYLYKPHQNYKYLFDDQFAYAHYCAKIKPNLCMLDYHQSLAASISVTWEDKIPDTTTTWPFVCRLLNSNDIYYHCPDVTHKIHRLGYLYIDMNICAIVREWRPHNSTNVPENFLYKAQLQSLDPYPAIYHGNGAGKSVILNKGKGLGFQLFECMLSKRLHMSGSEYLDPHTYEKIYGIK